MFTLAQISDTHLGADTSLFRTNFHAVAGHLAANVPDVIVATGDLSLDGADSEEDMRFAAAQLRLLPRPVLSVPAIMMRATIPNATHTSSPHHRRAVSPSRNKGED